MDCSGDARIVCEGDVNLLRVGAKYSVNMPSCIVTKPPIPGFVGFGSTYLGDYQEFLGGIVLCFAERGGLIEGSFSWGESTYPERVTGYYRLVAAEKATLACRVENSKQPFNRIFNDGRRISQARRLNIAID